MKCSPGTHLCLIVVVLLNGVLWAQTGGRPADDSRTDVTRELPTPSGKYGIGRQALDLTDNSHSDFPSSISATHREVMVYIWYPAQQSSSKSYSEYFPFAAAIDKNPQYKEAAQGIFGTIWPMIVDGSIRAHAIADAPPAVSDQFPVVLFFPGYSSTTFAYTAQIENLVSYGYVVVAIEDTNGSGMVHFSDGRIGLLQSPPLSPSRSIDPLKAMIASAQRGTRRRTSALRS